MCPSVVTGGRLAESGGVTRTVRENVPGRFGPAVGSRSVGATRLFIQGEEPSAMPQIHLDEKTIERLDALRVDDEEYDELVNELVNIYEVSELALFRGGDV